MQFTVHWEGCSVWYRGSVKFVCHYKADIELERLSHVPEQPSNVPEQPVDIEQSLKGFLDREFDYYCTEDDYYPPVPEDFEIEDHLEEWCKENDFRLISWDGGGHDDGYEPIDGRRIRWR